MTQETLLSRQTVNLDLLTEELRPVLSGNFAGLNGIVPNLRSVWDSTPSGADLSQLETTLAAHDAGVFSDNQKLGSAQATALAQGKVYLKRQLLKPAPSVDTIFSTLIAAVEGDTHLAQMVTNQQAIMENAHGWILDLVTPTALDKQRYILIVQAVIALLA